MIIDDVYNQSFREFVDEASQCDALVGRSGDGRHRSAGFDVAGSSDPLPATVSLHPKLRDYPPPGFAFGEILSCSWSAGPVRAQPARLPAGLSTI